MGNVIVNAGQVTPEWLTGVLREHGILSQGTVTCVTPGEAQSTFASSVWRLEVNYSNHASKSAPKRLFLKTTNPTLAPGEFDPEQLHKETIFYSIVAPSMGELFTIPCYDAAYEPETGASHILLKDVSETHTTCLDPLVRENCEQAVDSLARLHAFWWDHPRLGKDIGRFPTQEERRQEWVDAEQSTTAFIAALGDQLPKSYRATYERVLPALPDLFKRHATGRNLTLAHGDAHLGNFLFPRDAETESPYLIDWQFWHPTIGGTDLAFMIATEWEPETRRLLEKTLLQHYHRGLLAYGVKDYPWDDCWNDYRLSVILVSIFIPVWRWAVFKWAPDMSTVDSSMMAFEDLKCSDLL
jgi:thiamine kinase-like enzyme